MNRVYLDHNATTPISDAARTAMIAAMGVLGNPSSVHAEGRAAKGLVEGARRQLGAAIGAGENDIIFTSSATEAAALALGAGQWAGAAIEHDAVGAWVDPSLAVNADGAAAIDDPASSVLQLANSETGVIQTLPEGLGFSDMTQGLGKIPLSFSWSGVQMAAFSAHKLGGPKGIGALVVKRGTDIAAQLRGGGQEMGRRAGTENILGIVGFAAAAEAAVRDLEGEGWKKTAMLRDMFEARLSDCGHDIRIAGQAASRLPNTSCFAAPGWKGETQVMQMDLAGYAISAGSACSSGKVRASKTLQAMGWDDIQAASAVRMSLGRHNTEAEVMGFADAWLAAYERFLSRSARAGSV